MYLVMMLVNISLKWSILVFLSLFKKNMVLFKDIHNSIPMFKYRAIKGLVSLDTNGALKLFLKCWVTLFTVDFSMYQMYVYFHADREQIILFGSVARCFYPAASIWLCFRLCAYVIIRHINKYVCCTDRI